MIDALRRWWSGAKACDDCGGCEGCDELTARLDRAVSASNELQVVARTTHLDQIDRSESVRNDLRATLDDVLRKARGDLD